MEAPGQARITVRDFDVWYLEVMFWSRTLQIDTTVANLRTEGHGL